MPEKRRSDFSRVSAEPLWRVRLFPRACFAVDLSSVLVSDRWLIELVDAYSADGDFSS